MTSRIPNKLYSRIIDELPEETKCYPLLFLFRGTLDAVVRRLYRHVDFSYTNVPGKPQVFFLSINKSQSLAQYVVSLKLSGLVLQRINNYILDLRCPGEDPALVTPLFQPALALASMTNLRHLEIMGMEGPALLGQLLPVNRPLQFRLTTFRTDNPRSCTDAQLMTFLTTQDQLEELDIYHIPYRVVRELSPLALPSLHTVVVHGPTDCVLLGGRRIPHVMSYCSASSAADPISGADRVRCLSMTEPISLEVFQDAHDNLLLLEWLGVKSEQDITQLIEASYDFQCLEKLKLFVDVSIDELEDPRSIPEIRIAAFFNAFISLNIVEIAHGSIEEYVAGTVRRPIHSEIFHRQSRRPYSSEWDVDEWKTYEADFMSLESSSL